MAEQKIHPLVLKKYQGALCGALAGDASGAPSENQKSAEILAGFAKRGGLTLYDYTEPWKGKREIPAGHPTDDAELTAALATSLVECRGFNPASVYHHLRGFILGHGTEDRKSVLTKNPAYGSGGTLRSALRAETYADSLKEFREGRVKVLPTNGALMRCTPAGLLGYTGEQTNALGIRQSSVTHIHPASQAACGVYATLIGALSTTSYSLDEAWQHTLQCTEGYLDLASQTPDKILRDAYKQILALDMQSPPTEDEIWPHSGEVMLSLRIAVWGSLHAKDFVDGLTKVIGLGGDVDTYGAIAGGILGAYFGIDGIPHEWRDTLIGFDIMERLAGELYNINWGSS